MPCETSTNNEGKTKKAREIFIKTKKKNKKKRRKRGAFFARFVISKRIINAPKNELSPGGMKGEREGVVVVCEYSALWSHLI